MTQLATHSPTDLNARKALGRTHLSENRIEDALRVYASILRDYPNDVDSYLVLGDCYLADGDNRSASIFYSQALKLTPTSLDIHRRLRLADDECETPSGVVPSDPRAVADMLQHLTGRPTPVSDAEVSRAASLLDEIVNCPHPAQAVAEHLNEIDALLPALLELNIRQARSDGRPDLAQALQSLLNHIHLQMDEPASTGAESGPPLQLLAGSRTKAKLVPAETRILLLSGAEETLSFRRSLSAESLSALGCQLIRAKDFPSEPGAFDIAIVHNPHCTPHLMAGMAGCTASGTPVIVDLDQDYEQMPLDHPDYERLGLGFPARAKAYATALLLADVICTPSETLAEPLRALGYRVRVIPEGWSRRNELWTKPAPPRHTINLGWVGQPGQAEDVAVIRRMVTRVLREFPQTRLVIAGDPQVYQLFESLPEARRLYLPMVDMDDYPYLFGQIDILLAPLRNTPFNRSLSDRRLMEAGVRGIPWVASPLPVMMSWKAGGLIANTPDDWHTHLRQLVMDGGLRAWLGRAGLEQAALRDEAHIGRDWLGLIRDLSQVEG